MIEYLKKYNELPQELRDRLNIPEVVDHQKRRRWMAAARRFIREEAPPYRELRLDVAFGFTTDTKGDQ